MALANVRARSTGAQDTDSTTHTITMPGGSTTPGDMLICAFSADGNTNCTPNNGWTQITYMWNDLRGTAYCTQAIFYRRATGSDALTVTTGSAQQSTHITLSLRNAGVPQAIQDFAPSNNDLLWPQLNPSGGRGDYYCIAALTTDSSTTTSQSMSTVPTGFVNLTSKNPAGTQSVATFTVELGVTGTTYLLPQGGKISVPEQTCMGTIGVPYELHDSVTGGLTTPVIRSGSSGWITWNSGGFNPPTFQVGVPGGMAVGDLLLVWIAGDADVAPLANLSWDRADILIREEQGGKPTHGGYRICPVRLWQRVVTQDDANQSAFTFGRAAGGNVAVHITCFQAGTYDPVTICGVNDIFVYADFAYYFHWLPSIPAVNQAIEMGWFAADTAGVVRSYPTDATSMNYIGRESTGWVSIGAYWQNSPQSGLTSESGVAFSGNSQFTSVAITVRPFQQFAYLKTGKGAARGQGAGTKVKAWAWLKAGGAAAATAAGGVRSRGKLVKSEAAGGAGAGAALGSKASGVGAALVSAGTYLTAASGTSAAVPVPAGVSAGRIVVVALWLAAAGSLTVTKPANFAELPTPPETTGVVCSTRVFWTAASGADTGTYTFSWTGSVVREAAAVLLDRTVSVAGTPLEANPSASSAGVVVASSPAVSGTAGTVDRLALWIGGASSVTNWTVPTGYRVVGAATGQRLAIGTRNVNAAGPTGSVIGQAATGWGVGWGDAWVQ